MSNSLPVVENTNNGLIVTSETIAQGTENQHASILRLIDDNKSDFEEFGHVGFEIRDGYNNHKVRIAQLNEPQSTLLMTYLRNNEKVKTFKKALVKAFYEMAQKLSAPAPALSQDEIVAQALQITAARVKELENKVHQDAPKVHYVDTFVADNDNHLFRTVASDLMVGEGELRWALVYSGWIYHDSQKRRNSKGELVTEHLWSEYAAKKPYFFRSLNHQAPLFKGNVSYTLKITTPGVAAIGRLVQKLVAEHGSLRAAIPVLEQRYNQRRAA